jgi:acetylornithine deacetylase/succinyl-diaminopimelate desuccinylase-like protein
VHSGQFGGFAPDALTTLCRLLATFHTDDGDVAIAGLTNAAPFGVDYPAESVRAESGMLPGVSDIGTGTPADRLWGKPALTVIGLDTVSIAQSSNTLVPTARARVSLRVPPGMRSADALEALVAHCQAHAPWGAHVAVTRGGVGNPSQVSADGPLVAAAMAAYQQVFGVPVELIGMGGSIPLTGELAAVFPQAEFIVSGVADPDTRAHGIDESVSLADLERTVAAQVAFLSAMGSGH